MVTVNVDAEADPLFTTAFVINAEFATLYGNVIVVVRLQVRKLPTGTQVDTALSDTPALEFDSSKSARPLFEGGTVPPLPFHVAVITTVSPVLKVPPSCQFDRMFEPGFTKVKV